MNLLFIGHYEEGSTSKMRGEYLRNILEPQEFKIIDINIPLYATNPIFRSFGWRTKQGPLIKNINKFILSHLDNKWDYDLVWVEKGVFVSPKIIEKLKINSGKLVHFTPDPSFTYHRSHLFFKALKYYDFCITTKTFENDYYRKSGVNNLITCTQGFQPDLHKPYHTFAEKKGVIFIGHWEANREMILQNILDENIFLTLGGINWAGFVKKNSNNQNLRYLGTGVFGKEYATEISGALMGLGFLSKIIPELHTTRTLEIPACGTALITEKNIETSGIFEEDEVLFFRNKEELIIKIKTALNQPERLKQVSEKGHAKVLAGKYDHGSILTTILKQIYPKGYPGN